MRFPLLGCSLLLALSLPTAALARTSVDAEVSRLAKESHAQYEAGDYAKAAETLLKAYELKPVPALLFNVARTYEKAGNTDQAIRFYQRYIDAQNTDPDLVRQSSRAIERLHLVQDQQRQQKQAEEQKKLAAQHAEDKRLAAERAAAEQAEKDRLAAQQRDAELAAQPVPTPNRVLPYTLFGVGGAAIVGGVVLGLTASSLASDEKASTDPFAKPDLRDQAHSRALVADVFYGVGIVAAVTGAVLIAVEPKAKPVVSALPKPVLFDHGAGLAFGGTL